MASIKHPLSSYCSSQTNEHKSQKRKTTCNNDALAKLKADFEAKVKEAEDSKTALTTAKADLDTKTTELASVKAELEAFKKKPAEEPHQIVDDANRGQNEARSEAENYIATLNTARSLFNQLP